ncbi:MAG: Rpn family recombination-promoting nuclease/putative transposase [Caldilineaceae bacterium]|nr:Rpn family recombination-promoting nuclease/putative transposase [Caldilineaceae bacterium]
MTVSNPHDHFFRQMFSDQAILADFIESYLPADIVDNVDLGSLDLQKESFIDEELQEHQSDLLCRMKQRNGEDAFLYLLLEHKSYSDRWVALQLLRYKSRIWEAVRTKGETLSPIVPVVLYHGQPPWTAPRHLHELAHTPASWRPFVADFEYLLFDLARMGDANLVGRAPLLAALLALKHIFTAELEVQLVRIVRLLWGDANRQRALTYLEVIVRYATVSGKMDEDTVKKTLRSAVQQGEKTMSTWIDKYMEQGLQQGLQQGLRQGAYRQIMLMLRHRFGDIPTTLDTRLKLLTVEQLESLTNIVLDAETLSEFQDAVAKLQPTNLPFDEN